MKTALLVVVASLFTSQAALAAEKPTSSPSNEEGPFTTGWQLQGGTSASLLGGSIVKSVDLTGLSVNADLLAGAYLTDHFGLFAGARLGTGRATSGCDGCGIVSVRLPLLMQWSIRDRLHGFYFDAGLSFLNYVGLSSKSDSLTIHGIADLEGGIGYRVQHDRKSSIDVRVGFAVGSYTHADTEVPDGARATHYNIGIGTTYAFAP